MTQPLDSDEARKAVRKLDPVSRAGKETNYLLQRDGKVVGRVTIPKGRKSMAPKTFDSICSQVGVSRSQLREIAACRAGRADWEKWTASGPESPGSEDDA